MSKAIFCIASTEAQAQDIIRSLHHAGFESLDISVLYPDRTAKLDTTHQTIHLVPDGTLAGVGTGGTIGGALGLMLGVGAIAIPGAGPFLAAGPLFALLAGTVVGATVGGITGALIGLGLPDGQARHYEGRITAGDVLISVHAADPARLDEARRIFEAGHAHDLFKTG